MSGLGHAFQNMSLGYTESAGSPEMRAAVAATYESIGAEDLNVLVPAEGITLAVTAALEAGGHVVAVTEAACRALRGVLELSYFVSRELLAQSFLGSKRS